MNLLEKKWISFLTPMGIDWLIIWWDLGKLFSLLLSSLRIVFGSQCGVWAITSAWLFRKFWIDEVSKFILSLEPFSPKLKMPGFNFIGSYYSAVSNQEFGLGFPFLSNEIVSWKLLIWYKIPQKNRRLIMLKHLWVLRSYVY